MYLIPSKNEDGAYPPLVSTKKKGLLYVPEQYVSEFYKEGKQSSGFVDIEHNGEAVTSCVWNEWAYQSWLKKQPDPIIQVRSNKEKEISDACKSAIEAGLDVETTQGTEHFDLTEEDQINLTTALGKIDAGATEHPYHSKRSLCRMFSADEIRTISTAAVSHAIYHQTLCNHLLTWVRRAETVEELNGISYTAEGLPEDLAANMAQILTEAQNV